MKQFFRHLCCHNAKAGKGDCFQVLGLLTTRQHMLRTHAESVLPHTQYAAQRAYRVFEKSESKKGAAGMKMYSDHDEKMLAVRDWAEGVRCGSCDEAA